MARKYRLFGPATGGAMTATGGGAQEYFNTSGVPGNPVSDRLAREGQLQPGSPTQIPSPSGQPGVSGRDKDKNGNSTSTATGGVTSTAPGAATGVPGGSPGGGGGFAGGGGGGRATK